MAVASKDAIKQFYGSEPHSSYWHGCSQGGRQGYAAAAKYPHDFDGILATAPAIDLPQIIVSDFWGTVVMRNSEIPPSCVFEEYQKAIIATCDPLDGMSGCKDISKEAKRSGLLELNRTGYIKDVRHRPGKAECCLQVMLCTQVLAIAITATNADVCSPTILLVG
jgi:hypothetical protein